MEKKATIISVNGFMDEIEKRNMQYFRGEPADFKETKITASAFRKNYNYNKICKDFYSEISHKLSADEKENFLAFCQHYGIPTNLIDITTNPLIALWFACSDKDHKDEDAFVYGFSDNNNIIVDITELINDIGVFQSLPLKITDITNDNKYFYKLNDVTEIRNKILIFCKKIYTPLFLLLFNKNNFKTKDYYKHNTVAMCDIFFSNYSSYNFRAPKDKLFLKEFVTSEKIEHFPQFIYKPVTGFNRFVNQQSVFFYQMQFSPKNGQNPANYRTKFKPDLTIEIPAENKEKILKTLDKLAINRKTIFSDYDSIAQYIVEKNTPQELTKKKQKV